MYNLFYWVYTPKLMCTFSNYTDAKNALRTLKAKYNAQIWIEPVTAINSLEEWKDKFDCEISEYEGATTNNKYHETQNNPI